MPISSAKPSTAPPESEHVLHQRGDGKALQRPWGFDIADAKHVAIWHGLDDDTVEPAHGNWLADHIPGAELHLLPNEGHISIGYRFDEIVDDLVERAHTARPG
jgi:pimeloyl-ACP methyl ester carboxylesterase